nr:alcohol dehydrogenase catalytic domain-containing protein [uncultured Celeribacter sp.]
MTDLPKTMKAALCDAPGSALRIAEVPVPVPGPGQYLVRVEACGICHSDLHVQRGEEPMPPEAFPLILGHEGIGRIVAGEGPLAAGTRIGLPWLYDTCQHCDPCLTGHETFCQSQKARGLDAYGAFAEYAIVEAAFATEIPDEIDPVAGGPLLCAGLTAWSALERCEVQAGKRLVIIGAGGLGQYAIAIGLARGLEVAVVDLDPAKRAEALRHGASLAVSPDEADAIRAWGGADITLNFAPTPKVWDLIADVVNPLSQIVAVALVHDPVPLSMMWLINGGHRVMGSSVGTRAELRAFLAFAARHMPPVEIETLPFEEVGAGLERLAAGDVKGRLVLEMPVPEGA